jgi:FkbM family methyltransferase
MPSTELLDRLETAIGNYHQSPLRKLSRQAGAKLFVAVLQAIGRTTIAKARLFTGQEMEVVLPEKVSESIYRFGFYDSATCHFLLRRLKAGDTYIDIGAHYGFFALLAAELVGPWGSVVAVEPTPETFRRLERNLGSCQRARLINAAMDAETGTAEFAVFPEKLSAFNTLHRPRLSEEINTAPRDRIRVLTISLDALVRSEKLTPRIIKIDAEGAEARILEGGRDTIERSMPDIVMEIGDQVGQVGRTRENIEHLIGMGYSVWEYAAGSFREHRPRKDYETAANLFFTHRSD